MMKKLIVAAAFFFMSLCFGENMAAGNFGIVGGANFHPSVIREASSKSVTMWHAGLTYKFDLPVGFQIQPALLYNVKATEIKELDTDVFSSGYLELLASVQWGIDLILFRPFLEVCPFIGCGLNMWENTDLSWKEIGGRLGYGVGVGGGLQIWRFQLSARYNWNIDRIPNVNLSLAFFF